MVGKLSYFIKEGGGLFLEKGIGLNQRLTRI